MADPLPATITLVAHLDPAEQQQVLALVDRAAQTDGHRAVNEAGLLAVRQPTPVPTASDPPSAEAAALAELHQRRPVHVLARDPRTGDLLGYAQAVWEESGPVAALIVDVEHRQQGIGSALWDVLVRETPAPLKVWATGNSPAAQAFADRQSLTAARTLLVLGRSLDGDLPPTDLPLGIEIRTFRPGDEQGWLAVNARAFATHPEQGGMTEDDLRQRMAEPWFDPAGLFLAVRATGCGAVGRDEIVGFHWTKREPGSTTGEVYVIGVDPTAGVRGLGTPLLGTGLRRLRDRGARDVDLYVDADNTRALALYRRYGFQLRSADVMYADPVDPAREPSPAGQSV